MHGGDLIADVLKAQGVELLFTLCGGHISPILVAGKARGIRVVDVRDEVTAVFAADAVARLTGRPGVAAVTAGPGVTNTITALKNAQMAQSPVILLGGATGTILKGRGALQDIDQMALVRPHVKWAKAVTRVRDLGPALERAFEVSQSGVPGPVFIECPVDLLYDEAQVRELYLGKMGQGGGLAQRLTRLYLTRHLNRMFGGAIPPARDGRIESPLPRPAGARVRRAADRLARAERPVMLVGSQALLQADKVEEIARAVVTLDIPVYLSGMARGLLGRDHPLQMRHKRREAIRAADLVILAGVPADFRLDYGRQIRRGATVVSANRSAHDLKLNRRPDIGVPGDAGQFLIDLAAAMEPGDRWGDWRSELEMRDDARETEIDKEAKRRSGDYVNPLALCRAVEKLLPDDAILVADGGDFVATASYSMRPRGPLAWLDPGPFGTLGVGAGFALGAQLVHPDREVWLIYGDGAAGFSLAEFDSFARHGLPVIALIGNDGGWTQIAREQVEILKDDVGTVLARTDYHAVAEGFGGQGFLLDDPKDTRRTLQRARQAAAAGAPVLVNAMLGKTDFRKGSISI